MLIPLVQRVVGSLDKQLSPLKEASRQKCQDHAEDDLLRESGVHETVLTAHAMPVNPLLPESPLACLHDPKTERKVGQSMRQNAGRQAAGPIGDAVI